MSWRPVSERRGPNEEMMKMGSGAGMGALEAYAGISDKVSSVYMADSPFALKQENYTVPIAGVVALDIGIDSPGRKALAVVGEGKTHYGPVGHLVEVLLVRLVALMAGVVNSLLIP